MSDQRASGSPVLVRGSTSVWWFYALCLLAIGAVIGAFVAAGQRLHGVRNLLLLVGGVLLAFAFVARSWQARRRLWVNDTGSGFLLTDYRGSRRVSDDQVLTFALVHQPNFSEG